LPLDTEGTDFSALFGRVVVRLKPDTTYER
jgi:hypothetical protein